MRKVKIGGRSECDGIVRAGDWKVGLSACPLWSHSSKQIMLINMLWQNVTRGIKLSVVGCKIPVRDS